MNPWRELPTDSARDTAVADALERRYGSRNWKQLAAPLSDDFGLSDYRVRVGPSPGILAKRGAWGKTDYDRGRVGLEPTASGDNQSATLAHELGHVADEVKMGPGPGHHRAFANFEEEFPVMLGEQQAIELGLPGNPQVKGAYPWLSTVQPEASNRLASPWANLPPVIPAGLWNSTRKN